MSYQDYANIISGYNSKASNRREASESRIRSFNDLYNQRGLASMERLQSVANEKYNSLLEKAQATAIKNLNISEEDRAKAEAIVGAAGLAFPVVNKVIGKPLGAGVDSLLKKLADSKRPAPRNLARESTFVKPRESELSIDDIGGDLIGQSEIPELPELTERTSDKLTSSLRELTDNQRGKLPKGEVELEDLTRPSEASTRYLVDADETIAGRDSRYFTEEGIDDEAVRREIDRASVKKGERQMREQMEKNRLGKQKMEAPSSSTDPLPEIKQPTIEEPSIPEVKPTIPEPTISEVPSPLAEAGEGIGEGIGEAGAGIEGAEGLGAIGEAEAAVAPVDMIPGISELAMVGAGIYGVGEAFGWWGGNKNKTPIPTQPHLAPTMSVGNTSVTPTYRSFQRAYVAPNVNTGIMR